MAAVFGTVACLFFLLLEPVINRMLNPEEKVQGVTYPEENPEEELTPEEMLENEEEKEASQTQEMIREEVEQYFREGGMDAVTYEQITGGLKDTAEECRPWLADVAGITEDTDWFNAPYESRGTRTGIVIAKDEAQILVLVCSKDLDEAQMIQVSLYGNLIGEAEIQGYDSQTGLAVLLIPTEGLHKSGETGEDEESEEEEADTAGGVSAEEIDRIGVAQLGSSAASVLTGRTVIAVGRPAGTEGSISYGFVSSVAPGISVADAEYKLITTDIYRSRQSSGVLVNLKGEVFGIIDPSRSRSDMPEALCGIGISELKVLIEHLSAGRSKPYFGLHFTDIPADIRREQDIPGGVYISSVEDDSPAMIAGVQKGDILQKIGETEISSSISLTRHLLDNEPGTALSITIARPAGEEYSEMRLSVIPE